MIRPPSARNQPPGGVLNCLQVANQFDGDAIKQNITIVQATGDESLDNIRRAPDGRTKLS